MDHDSLTIVSASDGTGSGRTKNMLGKVAAIVYTKPVAGGYSDNVVILVKTVRTGTTIWSETLANNASKTVFPRTHVHDTLGAEVLYAAGGKNVCDQVPVVNDEVVVSVASAGNGLTGTFEVILA